MWICLNDAFVSIVEHKDNPDILCCRGRFEGDLQRAFDGHMTGQPVQQTPTADYEFRVELPRAVVQRALAAHVASINYRNFKGSVRNDQLHDVYLRVWTVMKSEQDRLYRSAASRRQTGSTGPGQL